MNTWSHHCNQIDTFITLPIGAECDHCKTNNVVYSLRVGGYIQQPVEKITTMKKIAALLLPPRVTTKENNNAI
jgi:hypothetical protein